jgi:TfoX/Sxy family transcriptional regulator of competence genes
MSTNQSTIDFIIDQLHFLDGLSYRKMFWEYALYLDHKVVALVCDDILYVKSTKAWIDFVWDYYREWFAYPWAKASIMIDEDKIEERDWIWQLLKITFDNLPEPKKKKRKIEKNDYLQFT